MGVGELHSKVLVEYKADISDLKAKIKELSGHEKALGEARLKSAEAGNKAIESQIKTIGRISTGLQIAKASGVDLGGEIQKLTGIPLGGQGTAIGFMFGGPWGAAIGTVSEMLSNELSDALLGSMRDARKADEAYVRLIESMKDENKELEEAEQAYRKVAEARRDADAGIGGMQRALDENTGRWQKARDAIVSYSMALSDVQSDRRAVLSGPYKDGKDVFRSRQEIELERSLRDARTTLEGATSSFGPVAAEAKIKADRLKDSIADLKAAKAAGALSAKDYADGLKALGFEAKEVDKSLTAMFRARFHATEYLDTEAAAYERHVAALTKLREQYDLIDEINKPGQSTILNRRGGRAGRVAEEFSAKINAPTPADDIAKMRQAAAKAGADYDSKQPTILERMFGPREEMDAYRETWSGLMSVVSSGYSAMIDGSMSFGQAAKKAAGDAVKAIGLKMLIEAAEQTATGFKMLAGVYTAPLAAGHFTTAAKYGAGAVLAGVVASQLGAGGGIPSGGSGGGAGARPSAPSYSGPNQGGGYQGGSNVTIVYGDQFADDSPRNRQRTAQKLVGRALGTSGGTYS